MNRKAAINYYLSLAIKVKFAHLPELREKIETAINDSSKTTIRDLVLSKEIKEKSFTKEEIAKINNELERYKLRTGLTERELEAYIECYAVNQDYSLFARVDSKCFIKLPQDLAKQLIRKGIITYLDLFLKTKEELKKCGISEDDIAKLSEWAKNSGIEFGMSKELFAAHASLEKKHMEEAFGSIPTKPLTLKAAIAESIGRILEKERDLAEETKILSELVALQGQNLTPEEETAAMMRILTRGDNNA